MSLQQQSGLQKKAELMVSEMSPVGDPDFCHNGFRTLGKIAKSENLLLDWRQSTQEAARQRVRS